MIRSLLIIFALLCSPLVSAFAGPDAETPAAEDIDDFWAWFTPQLELIELSHPDIDAWEARYRRRHLELTVMLKQGSTFLYPLALAVRDRGMPMELALLPIIESQLDPTAESPSGARGLWQILPSTAEHLGLKHNWWYDESADFSRSTDAALDYLAYLHERFGSWLLTLAAYNAGEGRVSGAMRDNRRQGRSSDYWHLDLRKETLQYVPKLLGLARVLKNPGEIKLPALDQRRHFSKLTLPIAMDVAQIAKLADLDVGTLYRLNPQLLRWSTPPDGPHAIYLPTEKSRPFIRRLRARATEEERRWHRHTVRAGESLASIATDHGSHVELLRRFNNLKSDRIRQGQVLIVANHDRLLDKATLQAVQRRGRLLYKPEALPPGMHKVQSGDSLWSIARQYKTSVRQLQNRNSLGRNTDLIPGQLIKVHSGQQGQLVKYRVRPGDVLSRIASRYRVNVSDIQHWNELDGTILHPGQILDLYVPERSS